MCVRVVSEKSRVKELNLKDMNLLLRLVKNLHHQVRHSTKATHSIVNTAVYSSW